MNWKTGPMAKVVDNIRAKTKIKRADIVEILNLLPEEMLEVFFADYPDSLEAIPFGFLTFRRSHSDVHGELLNISKTASFRQKLIKVKSRHNKKNARSIPMP